MKRLRKRSSTRSVISSFFSFANTTTPDQDRVNLLPHYGGLRFFNDHLLQFLQLFIVADVAVFIELAQFPLELALHSAEIAVGLAELVVTHLIAIAHQALFTLTYAFLFCDKFAIAQLEFAINLRAASAWTLTGRTLQIDNCDLEVGGGGVTREPSAKTSAIMPLKREDLSIMRASETRAKCELEWFNLVAALGFQRDCIANVMAPNGDSQIAPTPAE